MLDLFFVLLILGSFCGLITIGALIAWCLGFQLNEPEYYEHKRSRKQCK